MRRSRALRSLTRSQLDLRASGPLLRSVDVGSPVCPQGWRGQGAGGEEESWLSVGQGERKAGAGYWWRRSRPTTKPFPAAFAGQGRLRGKTRD